jgi:PAS domain S-box-containing protein
MTATNNTLTPAGIRHHVYELILLVVILGLFTGGYVFWQKSMTDTSQSLASDYHLNSSSHYLQAMLELRHMQSHGLLESLEKSADSNLQKISQQIQHEHLDKVTFYLVRDELNAALALQEEFADNRFDSLSDKLQQQLFIFTEGDSDYSPSDHATMGQNYLSVSEMLQTLKQLVQLHTVVRENLLAELEARKSRQNAVYIGLVFFLLVLGFFIIRRSLRAIDSVIIDHNRVEKALFDSEKHYRNLVETTAAVAFEIDLTSMCFTYISPRIKELSGFPVENWVDFDFWAKSILPDDRETAISYCQFETEQGRDHAFEYRMLRQDGQVVWIRDVVSLIKQQGKAVSLRGFFLDITDHKHIELEIKENEQWLIQLLNTLPNGVQECDAKGRIIFSNVAHHRILGLKSGELIGKNVWDHQPDESKKQKIRDHLAYLVAEKPAAEPYVTTNITSAGNEVILEIIWDYQYGASGEITGFISIISDITELKQTELALRRSQKMDAVGQMAGGIAHDFNNILSIVLGNLEMLEREITVDGKAKKRMEGIKHSTQRAVDLTRQLLGFSRDKATSRKVININQRLKKMQSLIVRSLTPQVEVSEQLAEELWLTEIDPGDFEDALLNLLLNARDAMSGNGLLTIETCNCELDQAYCDVNPGIVPGKYVQLAVSDTGTGLTSDVQEHIFEPFYTTKPQGQGTGLGLAMVYGFVKRSAGCIKVYSETGIGTTFRIFLPAVTKEGQNNKSISKNLDALPRGVETVLLVDDELALLELAAESLQMLGYRVLTASNGKQALLKLAEEKAVDLLFSDVVMPGGLNGFELAEQAVALLPELKVLLTSGYTEKAVIRNGQARFSANMLSKPYMQAELAYRVREALDDKQ